MRADVTPTVRRLVDRQTDQDPWTLYDRLIAAQRAAELAREDDIADELRALRMLVHTRAVHRAWGRRM